MCVLLAMIAIANLVAVVCKQPVVSIGNGAVFLLLGQRGGSEFDIDRQGVAPDARSGCLLRSIRDVIKSRAIIEA